MVRIQDSRPKNSGGGYTRVFGNEELGKLITKVHSALISSGTDLEKLINSILKSKGQLVENLDDFLSNNVTHYNEIIRVVSKQALKKSKHFKSRSN